MTICRGLEVRVFSGFSVDLAEDCLRGRLDVAFLRREPVADLEYRLALKEPLVAILPADHRLAARASFDPRDLAGQTFIGVSHVPRILRSVVNDYLAASGVNIAPQFEINNFAMTISLVKSSRGIALLPQSIDGYLPSSIVSRPLVGEQPTIDLVVGFHKENRSPVPKRFLSRLPEPSARLRGRPV